MRLIDEMRHLGPWYMDAYNNGLMIEHPPLRRQNAASTPEELKRAIMDDITQIEKEQDEVVRSQYESTVRWEVVRLLCNKYK